MPPNGKRGQIIFHRRPGSRRSSTKKSPACTSKKIGVVLTKLSKKQAENLGVPVEGPYKPEHYRY